MDVSNLKLKIKKQVAETTTLYRSLSPEMVIVLWTSLLLGFILFFSALLVFNSRFLLTTPTYGGVVNEGIIGTPRFINPVLATNDQDNDLASLVFAGLTKKDNLGKPALDLAESISQSDDNLHYDVVIKKGAVFHDNTPLTADDIIYTISLIQNPIIKSPHRIEWEGVSIEKKSDLELTFSLKKPFPLFMETLSIGILPKHIWKNLTEEQISLSDYNINAIGSGPYAISSITKNSGIPESITLTSHAHYTRGRPYIDTLIIDTFQNEKYLLRAFENGDIDRIHAVSPEKIGSMSIPSDKIHTSLLPRTFTVFFNPNNATFLTDKQVRIALQMAINKQAIVDTVLHKYGKVVNDPYPFDTDQTDVVYDVERARTILSNVKSVKKASSTLEIKLATANTSEMKSVAEMIKADWEKIGVNTTLSVYEVSDLNQSVIKERDFQALLFGTITENPSDLYAFWHSSQRTYPGLNISNYVSKNLDANLEVLRTEEDITKRQTAYQNVKKEFAEEVPGIFIFAPSLIYVTNDKVVSELPVFSLDNSSRFALVENWYRFTDHVWPKTYYKPLVSILENLVH